MPIPRAKGKEKIQILGARAKIVTTFRIPVKSPTIKDTIGKTVTIIPIPRNLREQL
jgi:hypothetical protein